MEKTKDYMVRGTAAGDMIRAFSATTKEMTEYCRKVHNTAPVVSAALGRLLTAGVMMGTMMKGDRDEITLKIDGDGPVQHLIVTADSHGTARGYVTNPNVELPLKGPAKLDVGAAVGNGTLSVIRDIGLGDPYVGQVTLVSGEIAEDITKYFAVSEQVPSSVALGVLVTPEGDVQAAGGWFIQCLPDCGEEVLDKLDRNVRQTPYVSSLIDMGFEPGRIIRMLGKGLPVDILDSYPLQFACNCSREKIEGVLRTLPEKELEAMAEDEVTEATCPYCNARYTFSREEIRSLVDKAEK